MCQEIKGGRFHRKWLEDEQGRLIKLVRGQGRKKWRGQRTREVSGGEGLLMKAGSHTEYIDLEVRLKLLWKAPQSCKAMEELFSTPTPSRTAPVHPSLGSRLLPTVFLPIHRLLLSLVRLHSLLPLLCKTLSALLSFFSPFHPIFYSR